jgi:hypothetical protein
MIYRQLLPRTQQPQAPRSITDPMEYERYWFTATTLRAGT